MNEDRERYYAAMDNALKATEPRLGDDSRTPFELEVLERLNEIRTIVQTINMRLAGRP